MDNKELIEYSASIPPLPPPLPKPKKSTARRNVPMEVFFNLASKGLSQPEIAKVLDMSRVNVNVNLKKYGIATLDTFRQEEGSIIAYYRRKILSSITDAEIQKADIQRKIWCYGVLYDKGRLQEGKSTDNISINSIHQHINAQIQQLDELTKSLNDNNKKSIDKLCKTPESELNQEFSL